METRSATSFTQQDWEHYARCYDRLNELTPYQAMLEEVARALRAHSGSARQRCSIAVASTSQVYWIAARNRSVSELK